MAVFQEHRPGTLSYVELVSPDPDGSRAFYMALFGWDLREEDMGEHGRYTQFLKEGDVVGALYKLFPEQKKAGVPPHWGVYLTVEDVDAAIARAKELAGQVVMGPMDVSDHGRMAVLSDSVGAVFQVWQAKSHIGLGRKDEQGALCWAEHMTTDTVKSQSFYEGFFDWATQNMDMGALGTYHMMGHPPETMVCGMMQIGPERGETPPHWLPYFQVDDLDASNTRVEELGGAVVVPATDIPGGNRFSVIRDPQEAHAGLFQPGNQSCD